MADQTVEETAEVEEPRSIEWQGESFELAAKLGAMPFLEFARVAADGGDAETLEGMAATYDLLENCFTEQAWVQFRRHAKTVRANGSEIMAAVRSTVEAWSARPTVRPSDSSDGSPPTNLRSTDDSSLERVLDRIPEGRTDLKLAVIQGHRGEQVLRAASA